MIKKIEHFWKGLSSDRTQISALPPEQYGDRFYNFIQGVTMSQEEAEREQLRVVQEAMEARQSSEKTPGRSGKQKLPHSIPPMPEHLPPPPPCAEPEARETIDMAAHELKKAEKHGSREWQVPDRTLKTVNSGEGLDSTRDGVLPVVEEAGEGSRDESSMQNRSDSPPAPTRAAPAPPIKEGRASTVSKGSVDKDLPPLPDGGTQDSGVRMTT
jgi:1-phosphatidylinositol-4-phosphate 5-kinase